MAKIGEGIGWAPPTQKKRIAFRMMCDIFEMMSHHIVELEGLFPPPFPHNNTYHTQ